MGEDVAKCDGIFSDILPFLNERMEMKCFIVVTNNGYAYPKFFIA
jgi:hypothetical protein